MKKYIPLLAFCFWMPPSVMTAQTPCKDYACSMDKARAAFANKQFKDAIAHCKAAKVYPTDTLIKKVFVAIEKEKQDA